MRQLALRSFRLSNFKAVRESKTIRFGPLTVLIGNNGSGKSSLIDGIETFRAIVLSGLDAAMNRWRGFEHVWNHAAPHIVQHPGTAQAYHSNPLAFQAAGNTGATRYDATMRINLGEGGNRLFLQQEQCRLRRRDYSGTYDRDDKGQVLVSSSSTSSSSSGLETARNSKSPSSLSSSSTSSSRGPSEEHRLADGQSCIAPLLGSFVSSWQFLMLNPERMGQPVPQERAASGIRLAKDGSNIAEYLNEIRNLDLAAFDGLLEAVRWMLPYAMDLQPVLTSALERVFYISLREQDFEVPGWLLSTGTLRIVALLACLRHPKPPPLLVIEEIENGLDPRTLNLVVEEIRAAITAGTTQVVLTTHSPYLLDLLDLSHIVVVERVEDEPVFRRPDAQQLANWSKSFSPGRLYTMGRLTKDKP
jgi:predicted ATPase